MFSCFQSFYEAMVGYMHALTVRIDQVDAAAHVNNYPHQHQQAFQQLGQGMYYHRYGVPLTFVILIPFDYQNCIFACFKLNIAIFCLTGCNRVKNVYMFTP
jgi:hypothetical protein